MYRSGLAGTPSTTLHDCYAGAVQVVRCITDVDTLPLSDLTIRPSHPRNKKGQGLNICSFTNRPPYYEKYIAKYIHNSREGGYISAPPCPALTSTDQGSDTCWHYSAPWSATTWLYGWNVVCSKCDYDDWVQENTAYEFSAAAPNIFSTLLQLFPFPRHKKKCFSPHESGRKCYINSEVHTTFNNFGCTELTWSMPPIGCLKFTGDY